MSAQSFWGSCIGKVSSIICPALSRPGNVRATYTVSSLGTAGLDSFSPSAGDSLLSICIELLQEDLV